MDEEELWQSSWELDHYTWFDYEKGELKSIFTDEVVEWSTLQ